MDTLKKDFTWNLLGSMASALSIPLMIIIATRISGAYLAGKVSVAFVTAQWFMILGNFGVRIFQASDINEEFYFMDYLINRCITCAIMMLASIGFVIIRKYDFEMAMFVVVLTAFKMVDAFADVFEGRFQQKGNLYIAGQSLFFRVCLSIIIFTVILSISNNIMFTNFFILIAQLILFLIFTIIPWKKTDSGYKSINKKSAINILVKCFPLFITLFMLTFINNSPKYAIEMSLNYEYQTYYNAIYFPAQTIFLFTGFIFRPLLLQISEFWNNPTERNKLYIFFYKIIIGVVLLTGFAIVIAYFWGVPVLSLIFNLDFSNYKTQLLIMILGGGMITITNFIYIVLTVMREQNFIFVSFGLTFLLSLFLPRTFVNIYGFNGAVMSYVITMAFLALLMTLTFIYCKTKVKKLK